MTITNQQYCFIRKWAKIWKVHILAFPLLAALRYIFNRCRGIEYFVFWQHRAWESGVIFFLFNFSTWDHIIIIGEFIAFSSEYYTLTYFVQRSSNFRDGLILIYALELPTSRFCLCPIRLHYVATLTWLLGKLGLNASFHRELPPSFASIQGYN